MDNTIGKCYCSGCMRYFVGTSIHEKHRKGDYSVDRRCMTEEEMRAAGLDCEKKNVRIVIEGQTHFEEHDVWFFVASRESVKAFYANNQG